MIIELNTLTTAELIRLYDDMSQQTIYTKRFFNNCINKAYKLAPTPSIYAGRFLYYSRIYGSL